MSNILLVEDDANITESLTEFLSEEGFSIEAVKGQRAAFSKLEEKKYDLVLLDIFLTDGNGFNICREIKKGNDTPVIFLTASGDEGSVVEGFDLGADDYVAKPFRPREFVSRIKKNGEEIVLSALEYRILTIFITNRGILLSRNKLLEEIWDVAGDFVNDNTLTVYIKRLRLKIEDDPAKPAIIKTVRGMGYRVD